MPNSILSDNKKQKLPLLNDSGITKKSGQLGVEIYFKLRELVPDLPTANAEMHSSVEDKASVHLRVLHQSPEAFVFALTQSQPDNQSSVENLFNVEIAMFPLQEHAEAICYADPNVTDADWHWRNRFLSAWLSNLIVDGHVFQQATLT